MFSVVCALLRKYTTPVPFYADDNFSEIVGDALFCFHNCSAQINSLFIGFLLLRVDRYHSHVCVLNIKLQPAAS